MPFQQPDLAEESAVLGAEMRRHIERVSIILVELWPLTAPEYDIIAEISAFVHGTMDRIGASFTEVAGVACRKGCAWCCTVRVTATAPEIFNAARHIREQCPELVARVRALLRRAGETVTNDSERIRLGRLVIDPATREVLLAGEGIHLTPTEFDLLRRLALTPHVVYGRRRLLEEVWGYKQGAGERTVDSHVRSIRRKLGPSVIRTVHGIGYALDTNSLL